MSRSIDGMCSGGGCIRLSNLESEDCKVKSVARRLPDAQCENPLHFLVTLKAFWSGDW